MTLAELKVKAKIEKTDVFFAYQKFNSYKFKKINSR